jgi:hypothetical protein
VSAPLRDSAVLATTCVTNALKSAKKPFVSRAVSGDHAPRHRGVAPQRKLSGGERESLGASTGHQQRRSGHARASRSCSRELERSSRSLSPLPEREGTNDAHILAGMRGVGVGRQGGVLRACACAEKAQHCPASRLANRMGGREEMGWPNPALIGARAHPRGSCWVWDIVSLV